MSRNPNGPGFVCDGCGGDIGNGGIGYAVQVIDYHEGEQRHRHLCYVRLDENGEPGSGCRDELLGGLA